MKAPALTFELWEDEIVGFDEFLAVFLQPGPVLDWVPFTFVPYGFTVVRLRPQNPFGPLLFSFWV